MNAHHHPRQLALLALTLSGLLARGADVMNIALFKRQVFFQSDSGAPVLYEHAPFGAGAAVDLTASNTVTSATVTLPSSVVENLGLRFERYYLPPHWECIETHPFTNKPALDSAWGDGQYQFTIETVHDGRRSVSLSLTGDTYPNVPHIQNFTNAQFVDASKDFVLKWDAFAGGTANDIVYVLILDLETMTTAFCTASPSDPSHLNGTATQVVIPAGSLVADKSYQCELWFDKVFSRNTTNYPGVLAGAAYVSETGFLLNTTSTNLPPTITEEPHNISTWVGNYDDSVGFSVTATGGGTLSYQWRTNGMPIATATSSWLGLYGVQLADAGDYDVVVANAFGSVTSRVAILTVTNALPQIHQQPQGRSVMMGSNVIFDVFIGVATPPLDYQWRFNGANISGAKAASYRITNAQPTNAGSYTVVVTNVAGAVTSDVAVLTVLSTPTATNKILSLDGVNGYAVAANSADLNLASSGFTITAWVFLRNYDTGNSVILSKRGPGSHNGWMLYAGGLSQGSEARKPVFIVSGGADARVTGNVDIRTNQWQHLAVVFSTNSGVASLYINGILNASGSLSPPSATAMNVFLGRDSITGQYFWNGQMDEVCVWNRALTNNEVFAKMSCKRAGSEPGLLAYWNFDDGTLTDLTGRGRNGTLFANAAVVLMNGEDVIHANCGQPVFAGMWVADGLLFVTLTGETGMVYRTDVSSNLIDWIPWKTLTNQYGTLQMTDPDAPGLPRRFYRALKR